MLIETRRLVLRPAEAEDAKFLADLVNDPEVRGLLGAYDLVGPVSVESEERWIAQRTTRKDEELLIVVLKRGDRAIGLLSVREIDRRNGSAHIGVILARDTWDRGYGTECVTATLGFLFDRMNMHRVWLRVAEDNARAIRCYEKCGFILEGVHREDHFDRGEWRNTLIMSVLAEEFRRGRG